MMSKAVAFSLFYSQSLSIIEHAQDVDGLLMGSYDGKEVLLCFTLGQVIQTFDQLGGNVLRTLIVLASLKSELGEAGQNGGEASIGKIDELEYVAEEGGLLELVQDLLQQIQKTYDLRRVFKHNNDLLPSASPVQDR